MANQCPNCGKSIRPSAKFCGFCGHVIGDAGKAVPPPSGAAPPPQSSASQNQEGNLCPHCGKPNRPGVKFCASCGKALGASPLSPTPPPLQDPGTAPKRKRSRTATIGFLLGVGVIICVSLFGIAWGSGLLDYIFQTPAPTATSIFAAVGDDSNQTETPLADNPTNTAESEDVEETATLEPTETEIPPSPTPTITIPPSPTSTPAPETVLVDDFAGSLDQWESWENRTVNGLLPAQIILGEFLDIKGFNYDKVGATAIQPVTLFPGLVIEFEADANSVLFESLFFDWYPGEALRPTYWLGPVALEISPTEATVHYIEDENEKECGVSLPEPAMRLYRIEFGPDWNVTVYFNDGDLQEICSFTIDQPEELIGRITFSGWGLVDAIIVTEP